MLMNNYLIIQELGRGGMATVYLAEDNKFDTNVAVKILNKELVNNENIRKRFLSEAKSMFRMTHPNIIKVTDLIDDGDTVAFVMEYVEGETLKEYLDRKGKLNDEEIKNLFSQMLDAVGYVHEQNLVHRDIKPSNFMLDKKGKIKLMDFGIAKNTDANSAEYTQTGTGMQMGTPMYMSPEQITETKSVTAQSDIYSLGIVLWQMVTGQKPYEMNTLSSFQLQTKIVNENLPQIQSSFSTIIEKATQKEIEKRFLNCSTFKDEMFNTSSNTEKTIVEVADDKTMIETSRKDDKTIFENKDEVRVALLNEVITNVTLNAEKNHDSKMIKLNDVKVIKVVFKGEWFLVDAFTEVYLNERLILKSSVKKGFNFEIDNVEHLPEIKFKIPLKKKILEIPTLNLNKNYLIEIEYSRIWGNYSAKPKSIIEIT